MLFDRHNNRAGVVWMEELQTALEDATDLVFIFDRDFELSEACSGELKTILGRRKNIQCIIPFLWGDRTKPNPDLSSQHHEHRPSSKAFVAQIITVRLLSAIKAPEPKKAKIL